MFWERSRKEMKMLLVATLLLFSAFALVITNSWVALYTENSSLPANSVGIYASVQENGVNTLAAQLDAKERELNAREQAIIQLETKNDTIPLLLVSLTGLGLFGLILLNFYLDSKRRLSIA